LAVSALAQRPSFEVAAIKPNHSGHNAIGGRGVCGRASGISVQNIPLSLLIEEAFRVKNFQVIGRPAWLTTERYDVEARAASPVPYEQCLLMTRSLLEDRFGLKSHRETREMPVLQLVLEKSGKLQKVDPNAPLGIRTFSTLTGQLDTRGTSMAQLADMLAVTNEIQNRVQDETRLDGFYQFKLEWTPDALASEGKPGPSLFTALLDQLGLKVKAGKGDVEVLVIDHIEKVPTAN